MQPKYHILWLDSTLLLFAGGPYTIPNGIYTEMACLPQDGQYFFTIYDSAGDGLQSPAFYRVFAMGAQIAEGSAIGASESTSFSVSATLNPTPRPTPQPTPQPVSSVATTPSAPSYTCSFCSGGNFNGALYLGQLDDGSNLYCVDLMIVSATADAELCSTLEQYEDLCCPPPASTAPCSFCSQGVRFDTYEPAVLDDEPVSCGELDNMAKLMNDGSGTCTSIQEFERDCCPSGVDRCEFCSKGLKKPDQDLTKEKDGEWFIDKTKEKITCLDVAVFLAGQSKDSGFCKDWDVFEDRCC